MQPAVLQPGPIGLRGDQTGELNGDRMGPATLNLEVSKNPITSVILLKTDAFLLPGGCVCLCACVSVHAQVGEYVCVCAHV